MHKANSTPQAMETNSIVHAIAAIPNEAQRYFVARTILALYHGDMTDEQAEVESKFFDAMTSDEQDAYVTREVIEEYSRQKQSAIKKT